MSKNPIQELWEITEPAIKCEKTLVFWESYKDNRENLSSYSANGFSLMQAGKPLKPELVPPLKVKQRGFGSEGGRSRLIHAICHIEFNAINLALDAMLRFPGMPEEYYSDWLSVAADESRHFMMLQKRLQDYGKSYGDYPAHDGLWQMAINTSDDCLKRMALVPRVLEARGLDVTPGMLVKLRQAGDMETVKVLEVILDEEVGHVEIGTRWFHYLCAQQNVDPTRTFGLLLQQHYSGAIKRPFNIEARLKAGFKVQEMDLLECMADGRSDCMESDESV